VFGTAWGRMTESSWMVDREILLEQAAIALLTEAKSQGLDMHRLKESAMLGVYSGRLPCEGGNELRQAIVEAVEYLVGQTS